MGGTVTCFDTLHRMSVIIALRVLFLIRVNPCPFGPLITGRNIMDWGCPLMALRRN